MTPLHRRLLVYAGIFVASALGLLAWKWPVGSTEEAVYHALLADLHFEDRILAIEGRTSLPREAAEIEATHGCFERLGISSELANAFRDANGFQRRIPEAVAERAGIALSSSHGPVARLVRRVAGSEQAPACLDSSFANHVRVSRVGFTGDVQAALVFVDFHCALCGYGGLVLVEYEAGSWRVANDCALWVS